MDELNFTEDEVREGLAQLGYYNVSTERIKEFRNDLEQLIREDRSQSVSLSTSMSDESNRFTTSNDARHRAREREQMPLQFDGGYSSQHPVSAGGVSSSCASATNYDHSAGGPRYSYNPSSVDKTLSACIDVKEPYRTACVHPSDGPTRLCALKSCLKKTAFDVDSETYHREHDPCSAGGVLRNISNESASVVGVNTSQDSSTSTEQRVIKRKVLRKRNGLVEICSESILDNDSDDLSCLGEDMKNLQLNVLNNRPSSAPPKVSASDCGQQYHQSHVACRELLSYNMPDGYQGPKALIRPMSCEPHMKNIKKSDPVQRYQNYRQSWKTCRAPGERSHNQLRWDIREQMLHHDQVVTKKPQPVHQPNPYVVPGDKKRKTLRWQIRKDLAQGIKPPSMFD